LISPNGKGFHRFIGSFEIDRSSNKRVKSKFASPAGATFAASVIASSNEPSAVQEVKKLQPAPAGLTTQTCLWTELIILRLVRET